MSTTRKVAAAEGMPLINRRSALVMGASLAATSIAAAAVSAVPADAAEPGYTWAEACRLADELLAKGTAEQRLLYHAKGYGRAARDIDPTAENLWMGRAVDDDLAARFYLTVSRQSSKTRP